MGITIKPCVCGVVVAAVFVAKGQVANAQLAIPAVTRFGPTDSTLAVTASEGVESVNDIWGRAERALPLARGDFPRDSIQGLVSTHARRWLAWLGRRGTAGLQPDAYARLLAEAQEDSLAQRAVAARLATPGLSVADRSYTYAVAVEAFADPSAPARLALAEHYLQQLNAMGRPVAVRRYQAELTMMQAYDERGQPVDAARHGVAAIHLVPLLTLKDCGNLHQPDASPYPTIVRAVAAAPNGRATIAEMNAILTANTVVSPDSVALDSAFYYSAQGAAQGDAVMLKTLARVGESEGPITSNRWLNRPDSTAGSIAVNDGRVRVLLVMTYECPPCIAAAMHLQGLADADPAMQAVMITWTDDNNWGNRVVTPDSNAVWQANLYVNERKIRYPIALWIAHRTDTLSDGSVVTSLRDDSTLAHYPETGKPQFYILDGQGRIRAAFFSEDRTIDHQIATIVRRLEQEETSGATHVAATP